MGRLPRVAAKLKLAERRRRLPIDNMYVFFSRDIVGVVKGGEVSSSASTRGQQASGGLASRCTALMTARHLRADRLRGKLPLGAAFRAKLQQSNIAPTRRSFCPQRQLVFIPWPLTCTMLVFPSVYSFWT
jgi:hypothetical protein